jgi:O-antigen ligase
VGLVCGALVAALLIPRVRRWRILLLLGLGGVLAFALTDNHFWRRMNTLTSEEQLAADAAASTRAEIWKVSLTILRENPYGIGIGNFPQVIGNYDKRFSRRSAHNTLVVCFTELGVHGGLLFLLMVLGSGVLLYRASALASASDNPVETKLLTYGILVSFVTYFVTSLGTERLYCESYWWVLTLPLCLYRVVMREVAAEIELPELAHVHDAADKCSYPVPAPT